MGYFEEKYLGQIAYKLNNFKVVSHSPYRANFRCPICGDSQKSNKKARGWVIEYPDSNNTGYYCHNCNVSLSFSQFLKEQDQNVYNDYVAEKFERQVTRKPKIYSAPKPKKTPTIKLRGIRRISDMSPKHPARQYVIKRKIPSVAQDRLFYAPKFKKWVNTFLPDKFHDLKYDEPRLVIPFLDKDGKMFGLAGRSFDVKGLRYITIMLPGGYPKLFGLDQVDFTKPYYVLEGPLDSLFLDNAVAMAGADGNSHGLEHIENATFIFDNEPRNKEINKRITKLLKKGCKIFLWPKNIKEKDINDWFLNTNITRHEAEKIIKKHTVDGISGELDFFSWKGA